MPLMPCEYFLLIRRQRRPCLLAIDDGLSLAGQHVGRGRNWLHRHNWPHDDGLSHLVIGVVDHWSDPPAFILGIFDRRSFPLAAARSLFTLRIVCKTVRFFTHSLPLTKENANIHSISEHKGIIQLIAALAYFTGKNPATIWVHQKLREQMLHMPVIIQQCVVYCV